MRISLRALVLQSLLILSPLAYAQTAPVQSLVTGWNLVGNNSPAVIVPVDLFGNLSAPKTGISDQIITVWKWNATDVKWMFYAPSLDAAGLDAYALSKSYDVLSAISTGDGYWVNAKAPLTLSLPSGTAPTTAPVQALVSGWNLVANNTTAAIDPITLFGNTSTPLDGITTQIVTVWKWDAVNVRWMFYAPSLTPTALATYAASKSYDVLTTILPGEGYWVNASAAFSLALPPVIAGVAASGAPIANATVTVTCGDGSTRTTTTDSDGAYGINRANCSEPWVISVTGQVGDTLATLVSLQATPAANDAMLTINVTPLTHAIAATLASNGDPVDLSANFLSEKSNITETKVNARKLALVGALTDTLNAAGINPSTFDIISTKFNADRTGLDKVLDNVKVEATGSGVNITNVGGIKVDDMGDAAGATTAPAADLSAGSITISNSTDFATALPKLPAGLDDHSIGDVMRELLNTCFAQPAATRGSIATTRSAACQAVPIASDYKHDGRDGAHEFDRFFTDARYDNAQFAKPAIIRFFSSSATDIRALIKFSLKRADGVVESFMTVGEKSDAHTGGNKMLRGNQRPFKVFVNGFVSKRVQIQPRGTAVQKSTYYYTGVNLYVGFKEGGAGGSASGTGAGVTGRKVDHVRVTGPGLPPAGVFLSPKLAGCDSFYAIAPTNTNGTPGTPARCTSLFRMSSRAASATDTDPNATLFGNTARPEFATVAMSDTQLAAIKPFSAYKFEVWLTANATGTTPDHVFYERLRSRPITMGTVAALDGEVDKVRWNTLNTETVAAMDPLSSAPFAGGAALTVKWSNLPNRAPTYGIQVQTNPTGTALYEDLVNVPFSASSTVLTNGTQGWPNMGSTTGTGAYNLVQLISRNMYDTQLFADWFY